jgi:riboflavin synthase alpha subunit
MAQPTITGTIAGVNGSMLTVTGSNGTTYTVDASNATLVKKGSSASSISAINVGDTVQIEGNASGTSVTATTILDNVAQNSPSGSGFFGAIKSFLSNLFHFKF